MNTYLFALVAVLGVAQGGVIHEEHESYGGHEGLLEGHGSYDHGLELGGHESLGYHQEELSHQQYDLGHHQDLSEHHIRIQEHIPIQEHHGDIHQYEDHAPKDYSFSYKVDDPHTGDSKSQHEARQGDKVFGYYTVKEADGTTRQVHYTADKHNGFQATVTRTGHPTEIHGVHH